MSSASFQAKLFPKNFSKNSTFDDSGTPLPVFTYRIYQKLHNIHVAPKFAKVITNLALSKESSPDCIHSVLLKKCETVLSYILNSLTSV